MKVKKVSKYLIGLFFLIHQFIFADVKLPAIISDNMVLQQNSIVKLWGWADVGEKIEIILGWNNSSVKTTSLDGKWIVNIKTPEAGSKHEIIIKGNNTITINNVLIGEVWLCSGQSNMEFPIKPDSFSWQTGVINYEEEIKQANYSEIRLFHIKRNSAEMPLEDSTGEWLVCTPENAASFSAVGYYFGKYIHEKIKMPIGLIEAAYGGTPAELWTKRELLNDSVYKSYWEEYQSNLNKYEEYLRAKDSTTNAVRKPLTPSSLWNGMIHPIIQFTIKGVIWYQGESNDSRNDKYNSVMINLINSWRKEWGNGDFPFYFVQIAPYKDKSPLLREAQLQTFKTTSNTGMVVITDAGDSLDIHPRNKKVVGERLAFWALAKNYGYNDIVFSGPIYKSMQVQNNSIILSFEYVFDGLLAKGGSLKEFEIAGIDRKFYEAEANIIDDKVIVTSKQVEKPIAVRFAWKNFMKPNLFNKQGLPASPFRTDNWNQ